MDVALDYNVVFSALYNKGVSYRLFLVNHITQAVKFFVPSYFWQELKKKEEKLKNLTKLSKEEYDIIFNIIKSQIIAVPDEIVRLGVEEAKAITPDPEDVPYVAVSIALKIPLLTGDLKLKNALKDKIIVYSPAELLKIL
ncbi:PIN domain-containing protein [Pyrococcus kukulkanii]|uniref:PIN domain-containing protein n=1 Tax=Pyrococcus kukulkanii TaxID=1609559 RepID=A0ABV4T4Q5_9EURY